MFALDNGLLYHANELGNCNEIKIHDNPDSIISIHCNQKEGTIIAISNSSQLMKFHIRDGIVSMKSNALKLSIELNTESDTLLSPFGHLICKTNKGSIHCFDLKNDENYELKIPISNSIDKIDDIFTHFVMCGNILTLYSREKMCVLLSFDSERNRWEPAGTSSFHSFINAPTEFCVFAKNALLIGTVNNVAIATEEVYNSTVADDILVLQTEISTFAIFHEVNNGPFAIVDTHNCICGIVMDREYICAWSVLDLYIYKIDYNNCNLYSEISMKVQSVTINSGSLYIAKGGSLVVTDLFGIQRLTIRLPQEEGQIIDLYSSFDNLIILTCSGTIKIMDISKKEPKLLRSSTLTRADTVHFQANNISVKGNADGTVISFLHKYSYQLYFYNTVNGLVKRFECDVKGVLSQHWDPVFPRLLVCETRDKNGSFNCLTLFISEKLQTFVHERDVAEKCCVLMGGNIPFKFFISRNELGKQRFHKKCIDGFEAVDAKNAGTISAMVDFTYYLIIQNLDKAHLCIINVENKEAWVKLAYASVQHERLDIAQRCLMKMDNGLGVAAVRTADKEAALAEVAIQLGWTAEAERLYKKSNRLDLLCDLYRRQHERGKAMDTCQNDTVQEESLNLYTKFYERSSSVHQKNLQGCISEKEMAKQLILNNGPIEPFLKQQNDVGLSRWYASYLESIGDLKGAKNIYNVTNDILSLVRIACSEDDLNTAFNLVRNTSSCSGAYHLARHLEAKGDIENALLCFGRSGKFNYAIRLAKSHGLDDAIFDLALQSEVPKIVECAHYFERCDQKGRAVELYIKGGEKKKALDLILKLPLDTFGQFQADALSVIHELGNEIPEDIAHKCFSILLKSGLHGQAFKLFLQYEHDPEEIFQLYLEYGIELTDTILDEITSQCKIFYNKSLLKTIAFIFKAQGKFTLACKKFTQGGDRSNAIKCLLQTGDTRHIISYAFTSRTKDVYIIAANYLQTL
jgi:intraflagellar transport protein 140